MEDIEISIKHTDFYRGVDTTLKITGVTEVSESLIKAIFDKDASFNDASAPSKAENTTRTPTTNLKRSIYTSITPDELKKAISEGRGPEVIRPFDEIDIPTDDGGVATVVCAFVNEKMARFIYKDCWDESEMNDTATNKTGYRDSNGRKHVLNDIYPHILKEWRDIITPRKLTETINGEKVEYSDPMWLPSATDLFGSPDGKWWNDEEDSFQLPIFKSERNRVKECGEDGTYPYWLRSVDACISYYFCYVSGSGYAINGYANYSIGFAPGFDI